MPGGDAHVRRTEGEGRKPGAAGCPTGAHPGTGRSGSRGEKAQRWVRWVQRDCHGRHVWGDWFRGAEPNMTNEPRPRIENLGSKEAEELTPEEAEAAQGGGADGSHSLEARIVHFLVPPKELP